ncbi:hypothetical protein PESP_a0578 [Pseudoalteromonas espejiana DSM 9414]|nr:hypothetical protein PESP_a0578 [Pseudoalteromonas espejiana DSM 9414]
MHSASGHLKSHPFKFNLLFLNINVLFFVTWHKSWNLLVVTN